MIRHLPENASGNFLRLRNSLISATGKAIGDYNMIEDGDTVLVCMSGGKDSHTLLMLLLALQERAPIDFKLIAMNLDQKQPGFPADVLPTYLEKLGVEYRIVEADILLELPGAGHDAVLELARGVLQPLHFTRERATAFDQRRVRGFGFRGHPRLVRGGLAGLEQLPLRRRQLFVGRALLRLDSLD